MGDEYLQEIWIEFLNKFLESTNQKVFNIWVKPLVPLKLKDNVIEIGVKTEYFKDLFEQKYSSIVAGILSNITNKEIKVKLVVIEDDLGQTTNVIDETPSEPNYETSTLFLNNDNDRFESNLNPKYVFENFVIGNSNRFAYAAAQSVADKPAHSYNPLFIYGGVGLGKTHLMQAIGNAIKNNNPSMKILYTSSEKFTNEIINSIQKQNTNSFREKYRSIDCLIIDYIQFLENKEATQEEFFHTFNALKDANKQIIISSDRLPKDLSNLEDRLRSRFQNGLTADIQAPDLETRIAILRKKAEEDTVIVPNEVIQFIASSIDSNIREIEGAFTGIIAYCNLMQQPATLEIAQRILEQMGTTKKTNITLDKLKHHI